MALIVIKNFVLTLEDGIKQAFVAGEKIVGELEDHWFVKAHCTVDGDADQTDKTDEPKGKGKKGKAPAPVAPTPDTTQTDTNQPDQTDKTDAPAA